LAKIWVEAYGCSASFADSEIISGLIENGGHTLAQSQQDSDLNLIVTCSVKDATANRMIHRIKKLKRKPLAISTMLMAGLSLTLGRPIFEESTSSRATIFFPCKVELITSIVFVKEFGPRRLAFVENLSTVFFSAFGKQPATTSGFLFSFFIR